MRKILRQDNYLIVNQLFTTAITTYTHYVNYVNSGLTIK